MRALPRLGAGPFLIHNSDSVWIEGVGSNLARLFEAWNGERMDCLMLLACTSQSLGYSGRGDFAFEADGRIRRRVEQEIVPFAFAGVSLAHPRLFHGSPDGAFSLNKVWDKAIAAGRAFGLRLEGTWMHVGTPEALAQAERLLAQST
jgi:MurNAc alpha-1-phosphate uridylyltransferase